MNPIVAVSIAAGALATTAVLVLVRPVLGGRMVWPALGAALVAAGVTTAIGVATDAGPPAFLLGLAAFTPPVLVLLEAIAILAGADRTARWVLMLVWGAGVFPAATIAPLLLTADCLDSACRFEDFGGALPLFLAASAFVLLAWVPPTGTARAEAVRGAPAAAAIVAFWGAFAIWLASLEGAVDEYIPRILLAAAVGPAAGALGWLLVDVLRGTGRSPLRSLGYGLFAGIAATASGAVTVSFPWNGVVGALAGIAAAGAYGARVMSGAGVATRWGVTMLVATAVGFLAPPFWGDTVGVLFTAQVAVLSAPLLAFVGVAVGALLLSVPAWVLLRRRTDADHREAPRTRQPGSG